MPHFFIESKNIKGRTITIEDSNNFNHIVKSLRVKIGEKLLLIDEKQIQYETCVKQITPKSLICEILNSYKSKRKLDFELFLAQSPLRSEAQNTIIEKATELGVSGIYPIHTDNCALKKQVVVQKIEKWQKIMYEAAKQCERADIPTCFDLTTLDILLKNKFDKILVMAERSSELSLKKYLTKNKIKPAEKVLVIIGPEGGFSTKEFEYFNQKNILLITLGDLILKAESAVIVTLGCIVYEYLG